MSVAPLVPTKARRVLFLGGDSVSAFVLHRLLRGSATSSSITSCKVIRPFAQHHHSAHHHSSGAHYDSSKHLWSSTALDDVCREFSLNAHSVSDPLKFKLHDLAAALGVSPAAASETTEQHCRDVFRRDFDAAVVASFKYYIPDSIIRSVSPIINVHPSLLPKYRGASPLFAPFLRGETEHGCSIIRLWPKEGMDCGDLLKQAAVPLSYAADGRTVMPQILELGCELLRDVLGDFSTHWDSRRVQERSELCAADDEWHASKLGKDRSRVDFERMTGDDICNVWRAFVGSRFSLPGALFDRMATPIAGQLVTAEKRVPTKITFTEMVHSSCVPTDIRAEADAVASSCAPGALYVPKSFVSYGKSHKNDSGSVKKSDPAAIRCAGGTWCWVQSATLFGKKPQEMANLTNAMAMTPGRVFPGVFLPAHH